MKNGDVSKLYTRGGQTRNWFACHTDKYNNTECQNVYRQILYILTVFYKFILGKLKRNIVEIKL